MKFMFVILMKNVLAMSSNVKRMKLDLNCLLVIYFSVSSLVGQETNLKHPDMFLSIVEIIHKYGYPVEAHEVTTEDGYMLTMYRIPHGRMGSTVNKKPVLLVHGIYAEAEHFIINAINNASMAYLLADNGYDVWLGNCRGTRHGRKHKVLDPNDREFWNFSWHEMGMYDLPAKIDHILNTTKKNNLHYIGHSQGGTIFFVMSTLRPEYQKKIILASLLAPSGYEKHFNNPFLLSIANVALQLPPLLENIYEFPPKGISLSELLIILCTTTLYHDFCTKLYHFFLGGNSGEVNEILLALYVQFVPSCSTKQLLHFSSAAVSGHFRPWDYGTKINMKTYGRPLPPDYPIENITVPTAMYYSIGDNFCYAKDVEDACTAMQNCVRKFVMRNRKWSHIDFMISKNLAKELIMPLIKFAKNYEDGVS